MSDRASAFRRVSRLLPGLRNARGGATSVADLDRHRRGPRATGREGPCPDECAQQEVDPTRSIAPAERLLGLDWSGRLVHDGWNVYDRFVNAIHQQCNTHLLHRCRELLEVARRGAVRFPRDLQALLQKGLATRDRYQQGALSEHGLLVDEVFAYLRYPGMDATNYLGEQAVRPAVVNRKVWGGNRTWLGAHAQSVLTSVIRTCLQRGIDILNFFAKVLTRPNPLLIPP
jgi:transposase